jgi:hypothetical protein
MEQTKLVFFAVSCGVGMEYTHVLEVPKDANEEYLYDIAYTLAIECAESFGSFFGEEEIPEDDEDDMFHGDRNFTENDLDYSYEDYDPKKHDQLKAGGGSFLDNITRW